MKKVTKSKIGETIILTITICIISLPAYAQYSGGTGEPNNPYQIATAEDLIALGEEPNDYDKHFILTADIDLSGYTFDRAVIAPDMNDAVNSWGRSYFDGTDFNGVFDGNDHNISHLMIIGVSYLGLFGQLNSTANIYNLGLEVVDVNGTGDYIGGLVGFGGDITNCYSTGTVSGNNNVGGLVGFAGDFTLSFSTGAVTGNESVGGLVGCSFNSIITNCYSTSSVSGDRSVGGLAGYRYIDSYDHFINCYSTGSIIGNSYVGGLVGDFCTESIDFMKSCFWDIETSGQTNSEGGTGLTTAQMQTASTFIDDGWDFVGETVNGPNDIWTICEGTNYPRFVWQISAGDFLCPDGITMDDFDYFIDRYGDTNCDSSNGYCDGTDLDFSGTVDIYDFAILLDNWLIENP